VTKKTDAWMPLYIEKYTADTMRLSTLQHGAYLLILFDYWRTGPLPDDDAVLANIAKLDRRTWDKDVRAAVRQFFTTGDDKMLHQKRADEERARAADISNKRRDAAMQRGGNSGNNGGGGGGANREHLQEQLLQQKQEQLHPHLQTHTHDARATRSVARPSPSTKEEGSVLRTAPQASREPDARDQLWTEGVPILRTLTGKPDARCRAQLGGMLKLLGDDCAALLAVLREAADLRPLDPSGWLVAAVETQAGARQTKFQARVAASDAKMRDWISEIERDCAEPPVVLQ
jgi:uncharacterized protein YdaU (DUF1376 family)